MRKHVIAASIGALALGAAGVCGGAAAALAEPDAGAEPKTLVIGVDGAAFDIFSQAAMPNLRKLQEGGLSAASNLPGSPMAPTVSGAGWSTIATGVWPDKHNVVDNSFTDPRYDEYPDYLSRIEAADADRTTAAIGTWGPISTTVFGAAVDMRVQGKNDADTTARAVSQLQRAETDDVFVHLDEVDGAGHGSGSSSPAYREALAAADEQIGRIVAAVESRESFASEDWLIVVTSDHGHTPSGGHGGSTKLERKTFVIAQGAEFAPGSVRHDVKISDIAPTVLAHDGVERDAAWDLDGAAVRDLVPDDFDALRPQLRSAVQEQGPGAAPGWTDAAPEGWSVDNSKMPTGGAPEFAGWSFMTDDFFSNAELGQHRENNVRSRDVFAVADSDEWDDVNPKGSRNFDSTLVSPEYVLNGAESVDVSFVSDYAVDGPQGAAVWVVFDEASGIPRQKLVDYPSDGTRENPVNRVERVSLDLPRNDSGELPAGLTLKFSYSGVNSAFWAIDQVRVEQPEAPAPAAEIGLSAESVVAGGAVTVRGTGFGAGERLAVELRSEPQRIGEAVADAGGAIDQSVVVPASTPAGAHEIVVIREDGTEIARPLAVTAAPVDPGTDASAEGGAEGGAEGTADATSGADGGSAGAADAGSDAGAGADGASGGSAGAGASGAGARADGSPTTGASGRLAETGGSLSGALIGGAAAAVIAGAGVLLAAGASRRSRPDCA